MSSLTLYRKYRPQTFEEIVNQDHVKSTVRQEIISGQLPHAFLFYGPRGIGKTTMARIIAKALNCKTRKEGQADPCDNCESCNAIREGKSLNLVEVDAASQTGVDNVRDNIIANARVAVSGGEYKIFIIDEVHMLSASSFNALLKTLEEPPQRVVFILATTEIHKIPATILSRCQRFDFHPISNDLLSEYLLLIAKKEKRKVDADVVKTIVKKTGGHMRDAMSLLGQILSIEGDITPEKASFILPMSQTEEVVRFFTGLSSGSLSTVLSQLQELEAKGLRPQQFCQDLIDFAHKLLLLRVGSQPDIFVGEISAALAEQVEQIAGAYTPETILRILDVLMKRSIQLKDYDQGKLPLELAAVEISALKGGVSSAPSSPPIHPPVAQIPVEPKQSQSPTPTPEKPKAKQSSALKKAELDPAPQPSSQPETEVAGDAASFEEVQAQWPEIMRQLSSSMHSLFIVFRTATLQASEAGQPELVFRFRMHHDYAKSRLSDVNQEAQNIMGKAVRLSLTVDETLSQDSPDEVAEPAEDEKEALGQELSQLADAFGGSVLD